MEGNDLVKDFIAVIHALSQLLICVAAVMAAWKGRQSVKGIRKVQKELEENPAKTVEEIRKANGTLSGTHPKTPST